MLTIIDDISRKVGVIFLKQKGDVFSTLKDWKTMIEKQTWGQVMERPVPNNTSF